MEFIKAASVAFSHSGYLHVVDSKDRLWERTGFSGKKWKLIELPLEENA